MSPNGRWIAYTRRARRAAQHPDGACPAPNGAIDERDGGSHPVWSPDGTRVYFDRDGALFGVDLSFPRVRAQGLEPVELPIRGFQQGYRRRQFDLLPDGKQFLMLFPLGSRS